MTTRDRGRLSALLLALCLALPACSHIAPGDQPRTADDEARSLTLERTVLLMRHGVRPPTRSQVTPDGIARDPWPQWDVPPGHLTAHGRAGTVLVGRWQRLALSERGLFPTDGCPDATSLVVRTNTIQRTRESGRGFVEGFAPGCDIAIEHADGDRNDPLFDAIDLGLTDHDADIARVAITARMEGDLANAIPALSVAFTRLDTILGCCTPPVCAASAPPSACGLDKLPHAWEETAPGKRVKLSGPLAVGATAAQSILLEYLEGRPMAEVGWGRARETDMVALSQIHAAEFDLLYRTPYIAWRAASPILGRVASAFNDASAPRLTVLVAHDTNAANVGGALGLHWQVPGYARDDPALGGALVFELLRDAAGAGHVRIAYQAQSTRQLRELQPLDAINPPHVEYMAQPLCGSKNDPTLCRLRDFISTLPLQDGH